MTAAGGADPLQAYSPRRVQWFCRYLSLYLAHHFAAVRMLLSELPALGRPTVLYANHPSWWDPLVLLWLLRKLWPELRVFAPIDAEALERYSLFRRLGAFATERGAWSGAAEFLRHSRRVLAEPGCALCVTAQGTFVDPRARPMKLERGVAHLLASGCAAQAVPIALEYPFWTARHPEALVRIGQPVQPLGRSVDAIHGELERSLTNALDELATAAISRDAGRFELLLEGRRRDVGGVYGAWRRLRGVGGRGEPRREPAPR